MGKSKAEPGNKPKPNQKPRPKLELNPKPKPKLKPKLRSSPTPGSKPEPNPTVQPSSTVEPGPNPTVHVLNSMYHDTSGRDPEADVVIQSLVKLGVRVGTIIEAFGELQAAHARQGLPTGFNYNAAPEPEPDLAKRTKACSARIQAIEASKVRLKNTVARYCRSRDRLFWTLCDVKDLIYENRQNVKAVIELMDDPAVFAGKRWSARLKAALAELGGRLSLSWLAGGIWLVRASSMMSIGSKRVLAG